MFPMMWQSRENSSMFMMEKAMEISEGEEVRRKDSTLIRESRDSGR